MTHELGIFPGVPEQVYRSVPGINQSSLKECDLSMAHYKAALEAPPQKPTPAQIEGTYFHRGLLEGKFDGYVVRPDNLDLRSSEGKKWRKDNPGDLVSFDIKKACDAAMMNPDIKAILNCSHEREVACWKIDEETGLLLKGRADAICTDANGFTVLPDVKTVPYGGARRWEFEKSIAEYLYHVQGAFYLDLFEATFFTFIVVEKEPPFASDVFNLELSAPENKIPAVQVGRNKYRQWLRQIAECQASGVWPAYQPGIKSIGLPEWAKRKENQ